MSEKKEKEVKDEGFTVEIRPIGKKILIQLKDAKTVSEGGILLPTEEGKKLDEGLVVEIGEEVAQVDKGDFVVVPKFLGDKVFLNNIEYVVMLEEQILLRMRPVRG